MIFGGASQGGSQVTNVYPFLHLLLCGQQQLMRVHLSLTSHSNDSLGHQLSSGQSSMLVMSMLLFWKHCYLYPQGCLVADCLSHSIASFCRVKSLYEE